MLRLFIALSPPVEIGQELEHLAGGIPGARWVAPEFLHITLRFLGEVDETRAIDIDDALQTVRAERISILLRGAGLFVRHGRPHSLWIGIDPTPALLQLRRRIDSALIRAGETPERRAFTPHLTLARLSQDASLPKAQAFVAGHNLYRNGFDAPEFRLFSSRPSKSGQVYTSLAAYPLPFP